MNCLLCEIIFCILFIYFSISTFVAELYEGLLHSFLCVFGLAAAKQTDDPIVGYSTLYYSYVIILSLLGNIMFFVSYLVYGPKLFRTQTQFVQKRQTEDGVKEFLSPNNQIIFCSRRSQSHVCVFTRYDTYALMVLIFISVQFFMRHCIGNDDFKQIEELVFKITIKDFDSNGSKSGCLDEWCAPIFGRTALSNIHRLQQQNQCCGWNQPEDWINGSSKQTDYLPQSCCYGMAGHCSLHNPRHFIKGCNQFKLPVRSDIDPTLYSKHCLGFYPIYKLLAVVTYQFGFKKLFDGTALLLKVNLFFPTNVKIV